MSHSCIPRIQAGESVWGEEASRGHPKQMFQPHQLTSLHGVKGLYSRCSAAFTSFCTYNIEMPFNLCTISQVEAEIATGCCCKRLIWPWSFPVRHCINQLVRSEHSQSRAAEPVWAAVSRSLVHGSLTDWVLFYHEWEDGGVILRSTHTGLLGAGFLFTCEIWQENRCSRPHSEHVSTVSARNPGLKCSSPLIGGTFPSIH